MSSWKDDFDIKVTQDATDPRTVRVTYTYKVPVASFTVMTFNSVFQPNLRGLLMSHGSEGWTIDELFKESKRDNLVGLMQELIKLRKDDPKVTYDETKCTWSYREGLFVTIGDLLQAKGHSHEKGPDFKRK